MNSQHQAFGLSEFDDRIWFCLSACVLFHVSFARVHF